MPRQNRASLSISEATKDGLSELTNDDETPWSTYDEFVRAAVIRQTREYDVVSDPVLAALVKGKDSRASISLSEGEITEEDMVDDVKDLL